MPTNRRALCAFGVLIASLSVTFAVPAAAQFCGDPDASGAITVTDGVNVLRQSAGLPSTCSGVPARCDVDGNGTVSLTDGVNVLRAAGGLAVTLSCGVATTVTPLIGPVQAALEIGIGFIPGGAVARAAEVVACESGSIDVQPNSTTFSQCRFGVVVFDGFIQNLIVVDDPTTIEFALTFTFPLPGTAELATWSFTGRLSLVDDAFVDGSLTVDAASLGSLTLAFEGVSLALSPLGTPASGTLRVIADLPGIREIVETFDGANPVRVRVVLNDQTIADFLFDPLTGSLTADGTGGAPARIARAVITISGLAFRFAIDDLAFGSTILGFDEPEFSPAGPIDDRTVRGVTFGFTVDGVPASDAAVGFSSGPGDTPRIAPPILEGDAAGALTLTFDPPVGAVSFDFATNPVAGAITSATLVVFDTDGRELAGASQIAAAPDGFLFPEGSLGASTSGAAARAAGVRAGTPRASGSAPGW
jgi:hypothetical protein